MGLTVVGRNWGPSAKLLQKKKSRPTRLTLLFSSSAMVAVELRKKEDEQANTATASERRLQGRQRKKTKPK